MNIFEQATRKQLRFITIKGNFDTETMWQLPLTSKTGFDLDTVAKDVNSALKAANEESFVKTTSPATAELELRLEILKHIIAVKLEEQEKAKTAMAKKAEKQKLLEALEKAQGKALEQLTPEEIQARLAALSE